MDVSEFEGLWSADPNSNTGDSGYGGSLDDEGTFATRGPIMDSNQGEHPTPHDVYHEPSNLHPDVKHCDKNIRILCELC